MINKKNVPSFPKEWAAYWVTDNGEFFTTNTKHYHKSAFTKKWRWMRSSEYYKCRVISALSVKDNYFDRSMSGQVYDSVESALKQNPVVFEALLCSEEDTFSPAIEIGIEPL